MAYYVSAGLFQDQAFELASQIFIDEKPPFYALANQTPTLTGQQVFEQFAGGNGWSPLPVSPPAAAWADRCRHRRRRR